MQTQLKNMSYLKERLNFFLDYSVKKNPKNATIRDWYIAISNMLNDELVDIADMTEHNILDGKNKIMAYISMEYLMGKLSKQSMLNLGMWDGLKKILASYKVDIEKVIDTIIRLDRKTIAKLRSIKSPTPISFIKIIKKNI